ncbi:copper chaperone PCu(A)C [Flindersiella endophytica]
MLGSSSGKIRVGATVCAAALALAAVTGCAATYGAETQVPYTAADGVYANTGGIKLRNLVIVSDTAGRGTLVGTVFNQGGSADALTGIQVSGGGRASLGSAPISLPAHTGSVVLGADSTVGKALPVTVEGKQVSAGKTVRLTFTFQKAAAVPVTVFVVARDGAYSTVPAPTLLPPQPGRQS